jgi:hypothetical protein
MKKLVTIIFALVLSVGLFAQKPFVVFGHVNDVPQLVDRGILDNTNTLWSLDAVVSGAEITFNTGASYFETHVLSAVGGAVGIKKFKLNEDGTLTPTVGASFAVLTAVKIDEVVDTRLKLALLAHVYNFTAGPTFTFTDNKVGFLVGTSIQF